MEISYSDTIKNLDKTIFAGAKKKIPENHLRHLSKLYYPMLCSLTENNYIEDVSYIKSWIEKCEDYI